MLTKNFLAVISFQLKLEIISHKGQDIMIANECYFKQMEKCIKQLNILKPDIAIFPEMVFHEIYEEKMLTLSKNMLIVFGSTYAGHINKTKVYQNGKLHEVQKYFPSGSESMIRFANIPDEKTFLSKHLKEHEFFVKGQKVYVLNCLEYYKIAYYIARDTILSNNLFGFLVPCSNNNPHVFMEESKALHNHNENIYSFVCNRIHKDGSKGYGQSYIYGPIQYHEKDWLKEEGILSDPHNSCILMQDSCTPSFSYGHYAIPNCFSRFGRSDYYLQTPKHIMIQNI